METIKKVFAVAVVLVLAYYLATVYVVYQRNDGHFIKPSGQCSVQANQYLPACPAEEK